MNIDRTPPPVSLAAALALPRTPGRSAEVFVDGDLEVRFAARPTNGPQVPHQRDEFYPRSDFPGQNLKIPGDGHPTGVANRAWAVLVRDALAALAARAH